ncbi:MAG: 2-oxoacid ferredoxin oxidoreductase [Myxococcales bacterium]|nr:2-oxoacid ferredoxin oxidoreductase [Myxococcales bacterium]
MTVCIQQFHNTQEPAWCPGCGNFKILEAVKQALVELELPPHRVIIATGIGQAPKLPHYLRVNTFNGLHGREVASATAIKLAAPDLTVLVHAGDGGAYGEGGNHFLHALRRNVDLTLVVHDNHYYGLTKGQASPTTPRGTPAAGAPDGVRSSPLNPLALAISQEGSFVAQGSAAHPAHLVELLKQAIRHRGFSLLNALQPCVTYDKVFTYQYYQEHGSILGPEYDPTDRRAAFDLVRENNLGDKIPLGVIYRCERPPYPEAASPLRERGVDPRRAAVLFAEFV